METFIYIFIFLFIISSAKAMMDASTLSHLRRDEEQKTQKLYTLKKKITELRRKIQDHELRRGIQDHQTRNKNIEKEIDTHKSSKTINCYFCDEPILPCSLICKHCNYPNYKNLEAIIDHELKLVRILRHKDSEHV